ncbi:DUF6884 domain-containing protein [Pseudonocardia halophobica]|uniref:DUF6884 domain-containing protein n=1 Tax=Pseudonocardia halophobica TaxID=29401 RepID=UPI0034DAFED0
MLVTCVKATRSTPSAAKDLYTSPLLRKQRAYAESQSALWFSLSAEHGLGRTRAPRNRSPRPLVPPLNLRGRPASPVRQRLSELRRPHR